MAANQVTTAGPPNATGAAAAGDVKALQAEGRQEEARDRYGDIVAAHQRRALRIANRYLRDAADAEEVVQDVFLQVYVHLQSFRSELSFESWLTRILVNRCLDRIRARRRRTRWVVSDPHQLPGRERFWDGLASPWVSPEDRVITRERVQVLASALAQFPKRDRAVIVLSHYQGMTSPEVGAITGLEPSTVRVLLFRTGRRLRMLLVEGGISQTNG